MSTESRDQAPAISLVELEGDDVIDSMVAAVASSGDEETEEEGEKGEVAEEEKGVCSKHMPYVLCVVLVHALMCMYCWTFLSNRHV